MRERERLGLAGLLRRWDELQAKMKAEKVPSPTGCVRAVSIQRNMWHVAMAHHAQAMI